MGLFVPLSPHPKAARGGKCLPDEAWHDGELALESWHVAPAATTLVTSSPQWYIAFALWGVGFFSVLTPAALDAFSLTVAGLDQYFTSHPHASNSVLNKDKRSQKPLSKVLFWSPSHALPGIGGTHVNHKTLLTPKS